MRWLALALAAFAGCSSKSNLQVSWTFSDLGGPPSAQDCSRRGLTSVSIAATEAGVTVVVPCAAGRASLLLEPRAYTVRVIGRSPRGAELLDPRPDEGTVPAALSHVAYANEQPARVPGAIDVTFRTLPSCANGIDDDGDGATDLSDPACCSSLDDTEGTPGAPRCPTDAGASRDAGPRDAGAGTGDAGRRDASGAAG